MKTNKSLSVLCTMLIILLASCNPTNLSNSDESSYNSIEDSGENTQTENYAGLKFTLLDDGTAYSVKASSTSYQTKFNIPSMYNDKPVTVIEDCAFHKINKKVTRLKEITLPNTITTIGSNAFEGSGLASIEIPNSVTSIGDFAFISSNYLENIVIPDSVTSLGLGVFAGCDSLEKASIGSGITAIEDNMFWGCKSLKSIVFSKNVEYDGNYVFEECTSLETIYFEGTIEQFACIEFGIMEDSGVLENVKIVCNYNRED